MAIITQVDRPKVIRVTVPGPRGPAGQDGQDGNSGVINQASDIDVTNLNDGALLQYDTPSEKWVARNNIITTTGTLRLNGGSF